MAVEMSIQEYIRQRSDRDGFETAMFIYQSALTQMGSRIEVLNSELNHMHSYNPIEYVKSRLKTPESIMKKLRKNGHNLNIEDMIEYVNDIAGIRITCSFFSEIYFVADMIARQDNLEVISIKDYISQPKESGYKSYHMLLSIPVALGDAEPWPWISGQVWSIRSTTNMKEMHRIILNGSCRSAHRSSPGWMPR